MIYYYIPDFYQHFNVNLKLLELIHTEPQMFYDDFKIGAVFGNFPNCIWNGGGYLQERHISAEIQKAISEQFNNYGVPLRLTMTNQLIEDIDCYDRYSNFIMKNLDNGFNQVLIASPILESYIRQNYPNYPVIKSILSTEEKYYDDNDKYFMSVLRKHKNNDIKFLKSIKNKDKIEILVNETCEEECPRAYSHYLEYAKLTLHQDIEQELHLDCSYNRKYPRYKFYNSLLCITRDKIKEIYEPLGFKHFKISGRERNGKVILDYAHYMVKPEWKEDFINILMEALLLDNK